MIPVGMPPMMGERAGDANLETNFEPAMTPPPIKNGFTYSMSI